MSRTTFIRNSVSEMSRKHVSYRNAQLFLLLLPGDLELPGRGRFTCDFLGEDGFEHFTLFDLLFATHCGG